MFGNMGKLHGFKFRVLWCKIYLFIKENEKAVYNFAYPSYHNLTGVVTHSKIW